MGVLKEFLEVLKTFKYKLAFTIRLVLIKFFVLMFLRKKDLWNYCLVSIGMPLIISVSFGICLGYDTVTASPLVYDTHFWWPPSPLDENITWYLYGLPPWFILMCNTKPSVCYYHFLMPSFLCYSTLRRKTLCHWLDFCALPTNILPSSRNQQFGFLGGIFQDFMTNLKKTTRWQNNFRVV